VNLTYAIFKTLNSLHVNVISSSQLLDFAPPSRTLLYTLGNQITKKDEQLMIYYFSGTGNSRWVAEQLAYLTNDHAINLINHSAQPSIDGEVIGLVFPVHAWGAPEPVIEFIKKLVGTPAFCYGVCTCGGEAGIAMNKLNNLIHLHSSYSIEMPNNYVMGSDLETEASMTGKIANASGKIVTIAAQVNAREPVFDVQSGNFGWLKSNLFNVGFNFAARSTKPFFVTDKCISCGICARDCPANTITMVNGKPQWGQKCYQCTACINLCPTQAIEYGKGTAKRGRYSIDKALQRSSE
jgi:ferredoxin